MIKLEKRKMERYGITFQVNGRGENAVFTIKEIEDPFKIYCITELDFDGRSDFRKALIFYYYFFNDVEFRTMPDEVKEYRMRDQKQDVSRQTIATYISKLDRKNLVALMKTVAKADPSAPVAEPNAGDAEPAGSSGKAGKQQ